MRSDPKTAGGTAIKTPMARAARGGVREDETVRCEPLDARRADRREFEPLAGDGPGPLQGPGGAEGVVGHLATCRRTKGDVAGPPLAGELSPRSDRRLGQIVDP